MVTKSCEIQFIRIILSMFFSILLSGNIFSQNISDTIFFKKRNKITGIVYQQYGSSVVKIRTVKGNVYSYNMNTVSRIGFGYRKEMEAQIILTKGDTIYGMVLERKYNHHLKIRTSGNRIIQLFDFEIKETKQHDSGSSANYIIHSKDRNMFWGTMESQKKYNLTIIRNIWTNQLIRISTSEILKIDSIVSSFDILKKTINLNDDTQMTGFISSSSFDFVFLRTNKYGDFLIGKDKITKIDNYIDNNQTKQVVPKTDTIVSYKSAKDNILNLILLNIKDHIQIYDLNAVSSLGLVSSQSVYLLPQIGINARFMKLDRYNISSEVRVGLPTNFDIVNLSVNLSPIIFARDIVSNISAELMPDIYIRFYDGGSKTTIGLIAGGRYRINSTYALRLRLGYSGGFFLGVSGHYVIKYK